MCNFAVIIERNGYEKKTFVTDIVFSTLLGLR